LFEIVFVRIKSILAPDPD